MNHRPRDLFQPARSVLGPSAASSNATHVESAAKVSPASSSSANSNVSAPVAGMREDEKFASTRAISRLVEMSSVEYIQKAARLHESKDRTHASE